MVFKNDSIICTSPRHSHNFNKDNQTPGSASLNLRNYKFLDFDNAPVEISQNEEKIKIFKKVESTEMVETIEKEITSKRLENKETCNR